MFIYCFNIETHTMNDLTKLVMSYFLIYVVVHKSNEGSLYVRKPTIWVLTRSDTNRPVQSQKQARSLKFRI